MRERLPMILICLLASVFIQDIADGVLVGLVFSVVSLRIIVAAYCGPYKLQSVKGLRAENLSYILRTAYKSTHMMKLLRCAVIFWKPKSHAAGKSKTPIH